MIRIHDFPGGARGLRVAWVCEEMGLAHQFAPVAYPPEKAYLALNPLGTVPTMEDGQAAISESIAIILYLARAYGPTPLLPSGDEPTFAPVLELTVFAEASLGACLNPLLAAHFGAPEGHSRNWSVQALEARGVRLVNHLSERLGARAWLVSQGLTLADIAIETALRIWQGPLAQPVPENLAAWRGRLADLPTYQRAIAAHC
jgi:glutathione S-transferase